MHWNAKGSCTTVVSSVVNRAPCGAALNSGEFSYGLAAMLCGNEFDEMSVWVVEVELLKAIWATLKW
jgi:hypothetical protein